MLTDVCILYTSSKIGLWEHKGHHSIFVITQSSGMDCETASMINCSKQPPNVKNHQGYDLQVEN